MALNSTEARQSMHISYEEKAVVVMKSISFNSNFKMILLNPDQCTVISANMAYVLHFLNVRHFPTASIIQFLIRYSCSSSSVMEVHPSLVCSRDKLTRPFGPKSLAANPAISYAHSHQFQCIKYNCIQAMISFDLNASTNVLLNLHVTWLLKTPVHSSTRKLPGCKVPDWW